MTALFPNVIPVVFVAAALIAILVLEVWLAERIAFGSAERRAWRQREQPLASQLNYWTFLDEAGLGIAITVSRGYAAGLALQGPDVDCASDQGLQDLCQRLHSMLLTLPAGVTLEVVQWTDEDVSEQLERYRQAMVGATGIGRALVDEKIAQMSAAGLRRQSLRLFVTLAKSGASAAGGFGLGLGKKWEPYSAKEHASEVQRLAIAVSQVTRALFDVGVRTRVMSAAEIQALAYRWLNPRRAQWGVAGDSPARLRTAPVPCVTNASPREQLVCSALEEQKDAFLLDGYLHRVLTLKALPTATSGGMLTSLALLPFHVRWHFAVETMDDFREIETLKKKRNRAQLFASLREQRNQEAEAQEEDVGDLIDLALRSSIRQVQIALTVVLSVDTRLPEASALLDEQTADVARAIARLQGAQITVEEWGQLDELMATLPAHARYGRRWHRCTSANAAHLLPVWQPWPGSERPLVLLPNRRANLVGFDPFDSRLDNWNGIVCGGMGAGKSTFMNYLLSTVRAAEVSVLIIDVGGSYRRLVELFGGEYFSLSVDQDCALNLFFDPSEVVQADGELEPARLHLMLAVIERMICDATRPALGNTDLFLLARAIDITYRRLVGDTPLLDDLIATLLDEVSWDGRDRDLARTFAQSLSYWARGPARKLLNRHTTVSLTTSFAAFDLKGLDGADLQSIVLRIVSGIVWNVISRDRKFKVIVWDEVWRLLDSPSGLALLKELWKTVRKYNGSCIAVSQQLEDFSGSPIAAALLDNSGTKYLLRRNDAHEVVTRYFGLNETERNEYAKLEMVRGKYSEMLVLTQREHFFARIALTSFEYWMATTHPPDLLIEAEVRRAHPEWSLVELLSYLARVYPHGQRQVQHGPVALLPAHAA